MLIAGQLLNQLLCFLKFVSYIYLQLPLLFFFRFSFRGVGKIIRQYFVDLI